MWTMYNAAIERECKPKPSSAYCRLHYESLLRNTSSELQRIYDFVGAEPLHDATLSDIVAENEFSVLRERHADWREGRFFRRGMAGAWVLSLSSDDQAAIDEEAGDLMRAYGYLPPQ